jgi:germacradienol/geosmin synthase
VTQLRDWMAAILNWHATCGRYTEAGLLRRYRPAACSRGGADGYSSMALTSLASTAST